MKNLIIDTPFRDSFSDYLVKGETILWEGQPSLKSSSSFDSNPDDSNNYNRFAIITTFIIGFSSILGILITWAIWRSKVNGLRGEIENANVLAKQFESQAKAAEDEIELKEKGSLILTTKN